MINTARSLVIIILALAVVAGPAAAQQTNAGAGPVPAGGGETKTFTLGDDAFTIYTISQADATRLQEVDVPTVSMPADERVLVAYLNSAVSRRPTSFERGPPNMIVFGPNGFSSAVTYTGALPVNEPMPTYPFTGRAGQAYLITPQSGDTMDGVLVIFE